MDSLSLVPPGRWPRALGTRTVVIIPFLVLGKLPHGEHPTSVGILAWAYRSIPRRSHGKGIAWLAKPEYLLLLTQTLFDFVTFGSAVVPWFLAEAQNLDIL